MRRTNFAAKFVLAIILAFGFSGIAHAQDDGMMNQEFRAAGHLFITGETYVTSEAATDNAFFAGGDVLAIGAYSESVFLTAGTADFEGVAGDDLFIAGGTVNVRGAVGDNLYAAGGTVGLAENATVAGAAFIAGGTVNIDGVITGDLHAGAGVLVLNGQVGGDVEIDGNQVTIGPDARIDGALILRVEDRVEIDPAAVILGGVSELEPRDWGASTDFVSRGTFSFAGLIFLSVVAGFLHLVASGFLSSAADGVSRRPLLNAAIGLATVFGGIILAVLFAITIIGIPFTLLLAATLAVLALVGWVVAAYWAGMRLRGFTFAAASDPALISRVGWTLVGLVFLAAVKWIPVVGNLAVFALSVVAIGATATALWGGFRRSAQTPPAT